VTHRGRVSTIRAAVSIAIVIVVFPVASESTCYGTVANGRIAGSVPLPSSGPNFTAYSALGGMAGRTHVHSTVRDIVVEAYRALAKAAPEKRFVYGETGWESGGRIRPHRTHQNGLSVDFMVPVVDQGGRSVPLPTSALNKFGYGIDFDSAGRFEDLTIDFEAIAEHLYQLDQAARLRGSGLALVIFDLPYLPRLFATPRGEYLQHHLSFMQGKAWVRHDEHYHVDFAMKCHPNAG
jgi:penicillin-insensitive murein endopeptidase